MGISDFNVLLSCFDFFNVFDELFFCSEWSLCLSGDLELIIIKFVVKISIDIEIRMRFRIMVCLFKLKFERMLSMLFIIIF